MELDIKALDLLPAQAESDLFPCQDLTCLKYGTYACGCTFTV